VAGKIKQAMNIVGGGTSNFLDVADKASLRPSNITISFWIKYKNPTLGNTILGKVTNSSWNDGYSFDSYTGRAGTSQNTFFWVNNYSTGAVSSTISSGNWYHMVGTYDQTNLKLYVNGVLADSKPYSTAITHSVNELYIGKTVGGASLDGALDDVRIYNYAFSAQEVANLYNSAKQSYVGATVRRTGLTLDLEFGNNNGAAAPTVYDTSGYGRHATSTAGSTSPTCNGKFCDFDGSDDYMTTSAGAAFDSSSISLALKFNPDSSPTDSQFFILDSVPTLTYSIVKVTANTLQIYFGGTAIEVPLASYQPFWKIGRENVLIVTGTSGNNNVWLNGNKVLSSDITAWTKSAITGLNISRRAVNTQFFNGRLSYFKVWNRLLTDDEVQIISADRQGYVK
jgi:hypothetical protein